MFEDLQVRPCIIDWVGNSPILFVSSGFLALAQISDDTEDYPDQLDIVSTFDEAKANLVKYLAKERVLFQLKGEMAKHRSLFFADFDGDYKDASVVNEHLCEHAADCLGYTSEVLVDAYSCPRSWLVQVTTPDGVVVTYPSR
jgi:hypothetical protein